MADNIERDYRFYKRLRNLLRRPTIKSRIPADRPSNRMESRIFGAFAKVASNQYMHSLAGSTERLARTRDYEMMDINSSILSTALNIFADDSVTHNEDGKILHIASSSDKIKQVLEELFFEKLAVEQHLWHWIRNMCKYGDFFLLLDVVEGEGITSFMPLPTVEIEREEAFDGDINSVRFKWNTASSVVFDSWQIAHFRIVSDDTFLPYGKSLVEPARRIWKQLNLIEDAMLVYRIQRAPERRIFYIDVGNISANDVPSFMQKAKDILKRSPLVDSSGNVDLRYNVHSQEEDYFLATRGRDSGTRIETLKGAENLGDIDDVRYVQSNLIAALGIPRAYLTFEEQLQGKTTLSQEDIRFAKTINRIQKFAVSELNKIAMIHLYALGYTDVEDLTDFKLLLTNPSTVNEQMKLELMNTRFATYTTAIQSVGMDRKTAQRKILRLTDDEIKEINLGVYKDTKFNAELQQIAQEVANANMPQQGEDGKSYGSKPFGVGNVGAGGKAPSSLPTGQQPIDIIPGGGAKPGASAPSLANRTGSVYKNSGNRPMSMSNPTAKKEKEVKEDEEQPKNVIDLFDPSQKEDKEIIKVAKKYDFLSNSLHERSKISRELSSIFINLDKKLNLRESKDNGTNKTSQEK